MEDAILALQGIAAIIFMGCTVRFYSMMRYFAYANWLFAVQMEVSPAHARPVTFLIILCHSYVFGPIRMLTVDGLKFFRVLTRDEVVQWAK